MDIDEIKKIKDIAEFCLSDTNTKMMLVESETPPILKFICILTKNITLKDKINTYQTRKFNFRMLKLFNVADDLLLEKRNLSGWKIKWSIKNNFLDIFKYAKCRIHRGLLLYWFFKNILPKI